jgi:hypothetical protein
MRNERRVSEKSGPINVTKADNKALSQTRSTICCERRLFVIESIPNASVTLHLLPESSESIPEWFAELVVIVEAVRRLGALSALEEEVKLVRGRMETFETFAVLSATQ